MMVGGMLVLRHGVWPLAGGLFGSSADDGAQIAASAQITAPHVGRTHHELSEAKILSGEAVDRLVAHTDKLAKHLREQRTIEETAKDIAKDANVTFEQAALYILSFIAMNNLNWPKSFCRQD